MRGGRSWQIKLAPENVYLFKEGTKSIQIWSHYRLGPPKKEDQLRFESGPKFGLKSQNGPNGEEAIGHAQKKMEETGFWREDTSSKTPPKNGLFFEGGVEMTPNCYPL